MGSTLAPGHGERRIVVIPKSDAFRVLLRSLEASVGERGEYVRQGMGLIFVEGPVWLSHGDCWPLYITFSY